MATLGAFQISGGDLEQEGGVAQRLGLMAQLLAVE